MTKYEWETELKKCMTRLPKSEQERVLAYYNELFADRADEGMSEKQIINEFGNPSDVAFKIMTDYGMDECAPKDERKIAPPDFYVKSSSDNVPPDFWAGRGGKKADTTSDKSEEKRLQKQRKEEIKDIKREDRTARKEEKQEKPKKRGCLSTGLFIFEVILFGGLFIGAAAVIWSLVITVFAVGYSMALGSVYAFICAVMPALQIGVRLVNFAIAALCLGVALVVIPNTAKIAKFGVDVTKKCWNLFFGWYTNKKGNEEKEAFRA